MLIKIGCVGPWCKFVYFEASTLQRIQARLFHRHGNIQVSLHIWWVEYALTSKILTWSKTVLRKSTRETDEKVCVLMNI